MLIGDFERNWKRRYHKQFGTSLQRWFWWQKYSRRGSIRTNEIKWEAAPRFCYQSAEVLELCVNWFLLRFMQVEEKIKQETVKNSMVKWPLISEVCDRSHAYIVNSTYLFSISIMCNSFQRLRNSIYSMHFKYSLFLELRCIRVNRHGYAWEWLTPTDLRTEIPGWMYPAEYFLGPFFCYDYLKLKLRAYNYMFPYRIIYLQLSSIYLRLLHPSKCSVHINKLWWTYSIRLLPIYFIWNYVFNARL